MIKVIKVGGSLFDMPHLAERLRQFLRREEQASILLFPGGGAAADLVRQMDLRHGLGEESCHWLALRMLSVNAHLLASLLPDLPVGGVSADARVSILDPHALAKEDEENASPLPHSWSVTSDSLALRAARLCGAGELILLKSTDMPANMDWPLAAQCGLVDEHFPIELRRDPSSAPTVHWLNFRTWQFSASDA